MYVSAVPWGGAGNEDALLSSWADSKNFFSRGHIWTLSTCMFCRPHLSGRPHSSVGTPPESTQTDGQFKCCSEPPKPGGLGLTSVLCSSSCSSRKSCSGGLRPPLTTSSTRCSTAGWGCWLTLAPWGAPHAFCYLSYSWPHPLPSVLLEFLSVIYVLLFWLRLFHLRIVFKYKGLHIYV